MANETSPTIHRDVVDDVPVYWTPEPPSGPGAPGCVGALVFRVGVADETLKTRGITHLVEHLVLHQFGAQPPHGLNGFVDGSRTSLHAQGTPAEVASFMNRVCEGVGQLPLARLKAESRVLRTEAAGRSYSLEHRLLFLRYGARGIGQVEITEFGLEAPDEGALTAWAAARFTRENASAWFWGPIPAGLSFAALPRGERRTCPALHPVAGLRTPAVLSSGSTLEQQGIGMGFAIERERWLAVPLEIARRRLVERLRYQEGMTYAVIAGVTPITGTYAHATLWAGCLREHAERVQKTLFDVLDDIAAQGPSQDELAAFHAEFIRHDKQEAYIVNLLDASATGELMGHPVLSIAELEADFVRRSRADWAESLRAALDSLILILPQGCAPLPDRFSVYPLWSTHVVRGRRFRAAAQRFPWRRKFWSLVVGGEGVSLVGPHGHAITVPYAECAGAVLHRNGMLELIGEDGFWIRLEPAEWRHGERAHATVLEALPRDRLIVVPAP